MDVDRLDAQPVGTWIVEFESLIGFGVLLFLFLRHAQMNAG
jgi:hypothetical protein